RHCALPPPLAGEGWGGGRFGKRSVQPTHSPSLQLKSDRSDSGWRVGEGVDMEMLCPHEPPLHLSPAGGGESRPCLWRGFDSKQSRQPALSAPHPFCSALISLNFASARSNLSLNSHIASRISR